MATMLHRKFPLGERCNCREIVIREVNGIDEQEAALRADMRGKRSSIYAELVRLAIVEVDGKRVEQPGAIGCRAERVRRLEWVEVDLAVKPNRDQRHRGQCNRRAEVRQKLPHLG